MSQITIILLITILIFILGNILITYIHKRNNRLKSIQLPTNSKNTNVIFNSKLDVLHKRISSLESNLKK